MTEICNEPLGTAVGKFCQCPAIETVEGYHKKVCGRHKRTIEKKIASGITIDKSIVTKKEEKAVVPVKRERFKLPETDPLSLQNFVKNELSASYCFKKTDSAVKKVREEPKFILEIIKIAIADNIEELSTLTQEEKNIIISLDKDSECLGPVIANSYTYSGSTVKSIDFCSLASKISQFYYGYQKACSIAKIPIKTEITHFRRFDKNSIKTGCEFEIESDKDSSDKKSFYKNITQLYFADVDINVCNCRFVDIEKWLEDENNIYMGPAFNMKVLTDSKWFIEFDYKKFISREDQNEYDIRRILKNIEEGKEESEKYLSLRGKTLGSLCIPNTCHTEVYIEVIRRLKK